MLRSQFLVAVTTLAWHSILFVTSIHQFIFTNSRIFFNKIWCYDHFNDAVKCLLMPPSRFRKGWMISIQKQNNLIKNRGLVNLCNEQDISLHELQHQDLLALLSIFCKTIVELRDELETSRRFHSSNFSRENSLDIQ